MIESIDKPKHLHTHVHLCIANLWYILYFRMQFQYVIIVATIV